MRPVHPAAWHGGDKMEMTEADLLRRKFFDDHAEGWEDHNYSPEVLARTEAIISRVDLTWDADSVFSSPFCAGVSGRRGGSPCSTFPRK